MDSKDVIEAIDRELAAYRKRHMSVIFFALASQIIIITGQKRIPVNNELFAQVTYTVFFGLVLFLTFLSTRSSTERIHHMKNTRSKMITDAGFPDPFLSRRQSRSLSNRWIFQSIVFLVAVLGITLTWTGSLEFQK